MKKRVISALLAAVLLINVLPFSVFSAENEPDDDRASNYLNMFFSELYSSGTTGKLYLDYEVVATGSMDSVGVFAIQVRNNDGTIHSTILGSTANGLLGANTWYHAGEYTLNLTSGNTYYCTVIVIARDTNGGDVRKITTSHVVCP